MAPEFERVDVWLGRFGSEEALDRYFDETYGEDDAPISRFAADMDATFYDHDLVERVFRPASHDPLALLEGLSFADEFARHAATRWHEAQRSALPHRPPDAPPLDVVVLVFGGEIDAPRSVLADDHELHHVGQFRTSGRSDR